MYVNRKFVYRRSKTHLQNVASLPCQLCGVDGRTQAAHSNQLIHGKGRGIKPAMYTLLRYVTDVITKSTKVRI